MTRFRAVLVGLTALFSILLVAGCGGDDSALSAKDFRAQANKLCEDAEDDTDKLGEGLDESSSEAEVEKSIDGLVERTEKLVADIRALDEPKALTDEVDDMLDAVTAAAAKIDDATIAEIGEMDDPFADANQKAKALKLDSCSD
jgi:hypothetical protein